MVAVANDKIPVFNVQDAPYSAPIDGTDATSAITSALTAAAAAANGTQGTATVFFPAGQYQVSQLSIPTGVTLQGVGSSAYGVSGGNMDQPGWPVSVLQQIAGSDKDMIVCDIGKNYQRFYDLGFDGNCPSSSPNQTSGRGLVISDDASGSNEAQQIVDRCFFFNFYDSGIYLGQHRRAVKILNTVSNYSLHGDGITVTNSDTTIQGCIFGSNKRAGICLGTTTAVRWASFGNNIASGVTHVYDNDIYSNLVGISVGSGSWGNMIALNGIDRNHNEGITVYSGYNTMISQNTFHSNGIDAAGTYGHIGLGSGVSQVAISDNDFGPQDGGITNKAQYGVKKAGGSPLIVGTYGVLDPTSTSVTGSAGLHN
jgi:hypothetical protein